MTRKPIITGLLTAGGVFLGTLTGPASALADGGVTTVYNNYGQAVYYTTNNNVTYVTNNVTSCQNSRYVPANYPADFAYPQVAPAAYGAAYQQPVYAQPVYAQPGYAQPVYVQPVYPRTVVVQPASRVSVGGGFGFSYGRHKVYHHRKVHHHRKIHRTQRVAHRQVRVSHRPAVRVRASSGHHGRSYFHHQPQRSHRSDQRRPHRGGVRAGSRRHR